MGFARDVADRVIFGRNPPLRDRAFGIHVHHQRAKTVAALPVKPAGQRGQGPGFPVGVDEQFIGIQRQAPVPVAVAQHQPGQPVHPETRSLVAGPGLPERDVGLIAQQNGRAIGAGVVHDKEVPHPQRTVVRQEMRQAMSLVAQAEKAQDVIGADPGRAVDHRGKLTAFADGSHQKKLAAGAQLQRKERSGQAGERRGKLTHGAGMWQAPGEAGTFTPGSQAYCAAFCIAVRSFRKSANSSPNSGRDRPKATVACRKPIFDPQS